MATEGIMNEAMGSDSIMRRIFHGGLVMGWLALCLCGALPAPAGAGALLGEPVADEPVVPLPAPERPIEMAPAPAAPLDLFNQLPPEMPVEEEPRSYPRALCQRSEDVGKPMSVLGWVSNAWACRETPGGDRGRDRNDSDAPGDGDGPSGPDPGPDPGSPDGPSNGGNAGGGNMEGSD